jgi:hypothetical protein
LRDKPVPITGGVLVDHKQEKLYRLLS